jgi:hypothetical protein
VVPCEYGEEEEKEDAGGKEEGRMRQRWGGRRVGRRRDGGKLEGSREGVGRRETEIYQIKM